MSLTLVCKLFQIDAGQCSHYYHIHKPFLISDCTAYFLVIGQNKIDGNCVFHELQQAALVSKRLRRFDRIKRCCNPGNKCNIRFKLIFAVSIKRIQSCLLKLSLVIKAARRVSFYSVNCCILIAFAPLLCSSMTKQGRPSSHMYQT